MRERDKLFKRYCNENNPTIKVESIANIKMNETFLYLLCFATLRVELFSLQ